MLLSFSPVFVNSVISHLKFPKTVHLRQFTNVLYRKTTYNNSPSVLKRRRCSESSNDVKTDVDSYDIVVSGGGLVGSAMACALGSSPYLNVQRIVLLEGGPPVKPEKELSEQYSNRVSAISPGSTHLLTELGVWKHVARSNSVKCMQVWDALSPSTVSFRQNQMEDDICNIVENHVLLGALSERLKELDAGIKYKVKVTKYVIPKNADGLVEIQLQDGTWLRTKLLIGADGFNSLVRQSMGVRYVSWNYNQHAIVANLKLTETVENNVAFQKFLPSGPVALLPLTNDLSSLVWTVTPSMAKSLMALPDDRFTDELNAALWESPKPHPLVEKASRTVRDIFNSIIPSSGSIVQLPPGILEVEPGSRAAFPLGLGHAANYVKPRCALIGDAAHRVHPLAGLGVNLGFGDVKSLADSLEKSVKDGNQIDYFSSLREYETNRQRHNVPIMAAIDGLNKLYSTSFLPLVLLRTIGLQVFDVATPIKTQCVKMASS